MSCSTLPEQDQDQDGWLSFPQRCCSITKRVDGNPESAERGGQRRRRWMACRQANRVSSGFYKAANGWTEGSQKGGA